ncbi:glycine betaine ABC transporter substrate-binding protein [Brevibacterium otitidis]|uniref:Glycine betaine ABC transporter substrate-binding protein n=1 Tax=Brevibacterium otitidis TaxID=53364 RepID=A0ABV5WZV9_9MICO|nr:glycine betaine ABC transporter substrate-binding protein [Brevibacterium otitidis]
MTDTPRTRRSRSIHRSRNTHRAHRLGAGIAALSALALSACGLQPSAAYIPSVDAASIEEIPGAADGGALTVTSKNFTEAVILGKISVIAAEAAGFSVTDLTNVPGSVSARKLMTSGQADLTWEYTGTAWLTYLNEEEGIPDPHDQWEAVHDADLANGLTWGEAAELNNSYGMAIRSDAPGELGEVTKMSQLAELPPEERTICVAAEFNSRPDGLTPLLEAYGIPRGEPDGTPEDNIGIYDAGPIYAATADGQCNFGNVYLTDGRIKAMNLLVLEDDEQFFPAYNAAPVFFTQTLEEYPELEDLYAPIAEKLTTEQMQELNRQVDVDGDDPVDVALRWMVDEGFVTER